MTEDSMESEKYSREICVDILREKSTELCASGESRYPCRSDFSEQQVSAIKAFLGPWPRALEAAGIKPERDFDRRKLNREKRMRAKRNRNKALCALKKEL